MILSTKNQMTFSGEIINKRNVLKVVYGEFRLLIVTFKQFISLDKMLI